MQAEVISKKVPQQAAKAARLPVPQQYGLLLRLLITDYRAAAPFLLLIGIALPLGLFWILKQYVGTGPEASWLVAGNIVMAVSFGSMSFATQRTALMKVEGELDYYGSLTIRKGVFLAALFTESIVFALPALISSVIFGSLLLDIPLSTLAPGLPIALLAAASLTIVRSTIGSFAKNMVHFAILSYLPYLIVTFLSPVLLPYEKLPAPLKATSHLLPTGEAVLALNDAFRDDIGARFWMLIGALVLWLAAAIAIALRKLDWRTN